jgi:hypothetical protein
MAHFGRGLSPNAQAGTEHRGSDEIESTRTDPPSLDRSVSATPGGVGIVQLFTRVNTIGAIVGPDGMVYRSRSVPLQV